MKTNPGYPDMNVARLGEEEAATLQNMGGKWKRPLDTKPDPGCAADWTALTGYPIPEWLLDAKFGMFKVS